jgi:poly(A) polymerase
MIAAAAPPAPASLREAAWLTRPATQAVFAALAAHGHEARAVGGAVRDALLGRSVGDVDLATPARPEAVMAAAQAAGLKAIATGLAHGTVTVIAEGHP